MRTDIAMWGAEPMVSGRGMRQRFPAVGLHGGGPGGPGRFLLRPGREEEHGLPGVFSELSVTRARRSAWKRRAAPVTATPWNATRARAGRRGAGKVSAAAAREHYGVVIENGRVDRARTEALRGLRTSEGERIPGDVVTDEETNEQAEDPFLLLRPRTESERRCGQGGGGAQSRTPVPRST